MKKKELPKVQPVKLKPILGMKPGLWLTILYALIIVLFLFFVGILPDLLKPSKRVSFSSLSYNAAVYVDGNYAGGTPFTKKIPSGTHNVSYQINGVEIDNFEIKVSKPVFFSWLFPRKMKVESSALLTSGTYQALVSEFLQDVYDYSAILEYSKAHVYPPLYTNFAKTIKNSLNVCSNYKEIMDVSLCFATSKEMQEDAENAFEILGLTFVSKSDSPLKANAVSIKKEVSLATPFFTVTGYDLGSFKVARSCVTEEMYRIFASQTGRTNSNPYYLADVNNSSSVPVRNISFYDAVAFCDWLSEITGHTVVLPTEQMWMDASSVASSTYQRSVSSISTEHKPIGMFGGLWEITSSVYIPFDNGNVQSILDNYGVVGEMIVKGGSYVNQNIGAADKGSLPKDTCSDFLGFRIFWY